MMMMMMINTYKTRYDELYTIELNYNSISPILSKEKVQRFLSVAIIDIVSLLNTS